MIVTLEAFDESFHYIFLRSDRQRYKDEELKSPKYQAESAHQNQVQLLASVFIKLEKTQASTFIQ